MAGSETVDPESWDDEAELGFWKPLARKRTPNTQLNLMYAQYRALVPTRPNDAIELAEAIVNDHRFDTSVRGEAKALLAETAEDAGNYNEAIKLVLEWSALDPEAAISRLTRLVIEHGSAGQASDAADIVETAPITWAPSWDFHRAALLHRAGRGDEGRLLAVASFDALAAAEVVPGIRPLRNWSSGIDSLDREIFTLTRRGGRLRIAGLLDHDSEVTPATIQTRLQAMSLFQDGHFEASNNRLVVDLADCSFDLRWSAEEGHLSQVQRTYETLRYPLRRQIIEPPVEPAAALLVLGIADDLSHPTIVNQMIEMATTLDRFDCCIFLNMTGPISKRDVLPDIEPLDRKGFVKVVREKLGPTLKAAGFRKTADTRFDLANGPLGHHAAITLRFSPSERGRIATWLSIHYEELCNKESLNRDPEGNLRPTAFRVGDQAYATQSIDRVPRDPGIDSAEAIIDEIVSVVQQDWLPAVMTTRDPVAELERLASVDPETGHGRPLLQEDPFWKPAFNASVGVKIAEKLELPDWVERFRFLADPSPERPSTHK